MVLGPTPKRKTPPYRAPNPDPLGVVTLLDVGSPLPVAALVLPLVALSQIVSAIRASKVSFWFIKMTYINTYIHMYTSTYLYIYIYLNIRIYIYMYIYFFYLRICIYIYTHIYIYLYIHAHIYICFVIAPTLLSSMSQCTRLILLSVTIFDSPLLRLGKLAGQVVLSAWTAVG